MKLSHHILTVMALATLPATATALFHTRLEKSEPGKDAALAAAPTEIRLWFNERVEPRLSTMMVVKADSTRVSLGPVKATDDPMSITAPVSGPMGPGAYQVRWRTSGKDGHAVRGSFNFSITR